MHKIPLIFGLGMVLLAFLARKFLCDRVMKREGDGEVSLTGEEMARRVLDRGKAGDVALELKARPFLALSAERLVLSPKLAASREAREVAEAGLRAGLVLMARRQAKVVGWRKWAVKFGSAMPVFTVVVLIFARVMGRLPTAWCLAIAAGMLGLATLFLWLTVPVERAAASAVSDLLEDSALVARRSEGERLSALVKALSWRRIVPGALAWLGKK